MYGRCQFSVDESVTSSFLKRRRIEYITTHCLKTEWVRVLKLDLSPQYSRSVREPSTQRSRLLQLARKKIVG